MTAVIIPFRRPQLDAIRAGAEEDPYEGPLRVSPIFRDAWLSSLDGLSEIRISIGRSSEGFHYGSEISQQGGDTDTCWSDAYETEIAARLAASIFLREWSRDCA